MIDAYTDICVVVVVIFLSFFHCLFCPFRNCNTERIVHGPMRCAVCTGVYTPGMMTDVVREVKEAARIREEALLSRVRALVEERSWSMSESNLKMLRDLEEMKVSFCTQCELFFVWSSAI